MGDIQDTPGWPKDFYPSPQPTLDGKPSEVEQLFEYSRRRLIMENTSLRARVQELEAELIRRSTVGHGCNCWVCRAKGEKR